jgi:hypothetical protein
MWVPLVRRHLAGDDRRSSAAPVLEDFEEISPLGLGDRVPSPNHRGQARPPIWPSATGPPSPQRYLRHRSDRPYRPSRRRDRHRPTATGAAMPRRRGVTSRQEPGCLIARSSSTRPASRSHAQRPRQELRREIASRPELEPLAHGAHTRARRRRDPRR